MLHALFDLGGLIFWVITGIAFLALVSEVQSEKVGAATWTIIIYLALVGLFATPDWWAWIQENPRYVIYGVLAFIGIGALWSVAKWYFFLLNARDAYEEFRKDYLATHKLDGIPVDAVGRQKFKDELSKDYKMRRYGYSFPPQASQHKGRITNWMIFWPFSIVGTFLGDFLTRVFSTIYRNLAGLMQRISNSVFGKYAELED